MTSKVYHSQLQLTPPHITRSTHFQFSHLHALSVLRLSKKTKGSRVSLSVSLSRLKRGKDEALKMYDDLLLLLPMPRAAVARAAGVGRAFELQHNELS